MCSIYSHQYTDHIIRPLGWTWVERRFPAFLHVLRVDPDRVDAVAAAGRQWAGWGQPQGAAEASEGGDREGDGAGSSRVDRGGAVAAPDSGDFGGGGGGGGGEGGGEGGGPSGGPQQAGQAGRVAALEAKVDAVLRELRLLRVGLAGGGAAGGGGAAAAH